MVPPGRLFPRCPPQAMATSVCPACRKAPAVRAPQGRLRDPGPIGLAIARGVMAPSLTATTTPASAPSYTTASAGAAKRPVSASRTGGPPAHLRPIDLMDKVAGRQMVRAALHQCRLFAGASLFRIGGSGPKTAADSGSTGEVTSPFSRMCRRSRWRPGTGMAEMSPRV